MPLIDGEEAVVLHQHRRLHAGEVRARRDADAFLFLRQPHQDHLGIVFGQADQVHEPRLRQRRHQANAARLQRVVDEPASVPLRRATWRPDYATCVLRLSAELLII